MSLLVFVLLVLVIAFMEFTLCCDAWCYVLRPGLTGDWVFCKNCARHV